ncbi:Os05g0187600 [Oryza sativa Japonica Group]|uniref:Os05g0187600 protein n=1 Tax=Oryza sativa subsp. japonica TaxID=39947 RepID=C7J2L0_ORYSJ|nr:Os05g0187600 [Oryza sativa Japonica Group]|eukprot:NP_001174252.1 Os05g0187600 [Oryza sativa Japonica Group]
MRGASRLAVVVGREEGASSPVDGVASDEAGFREGGERSTARRRSERFPRVRGARRRELLRFFPVERARLERASEAASDPLAHAVSLGIVDGVMGLGPSNTSLVYQLAKSQKWKKMFAHCLDGKRSGGIFVLGHIVGPKVRKTPLDQTSSRYRTTLLEITVGETSLSLSAGNVEIKSQNMTILETGSLISYLPEKIFSDLEDISVINIGGYSCFHYERRMNSDVKWDDEDVWSHDRVKLETEHTTPADNTSEKTEVHSGLLSRSRTRLLAMIGALVCYARRSITKLFAMIDERMNVTGLQRGRRKRASSSMVNPNPNASSASSSVPTLWKSQAAEAAPSVK